MAYLVATLIVFGPWKFRNKMIKSWATFIHFRKHSRCSSLNDVHFWTTNFMYVSALFYSPSSVFWLYSPFSLTALQILHTRYTNFEINILPNRYKFCFALDLRYFNARKKRKFFLSPKRLVSLDTQPKLFNSKILASYFLSSLQSTNVRYLIEFWYSNKSKVTNSRYFTIYARFPLYVFYSTLPDQVSAESTSFS